MRYQLRWGWTSLLETDDLAEAIDEARRLKKGVIYDTWTDSIVWRFDLEG
jgi:hypothetical protein